jgi:hypothetical protein
LGFHFGVSLSAPVSSYITTRFLFTLKGDDKMFNRNEGTVDRMVRLVVSLMLLPAGLFWLGGWQGNVPGLLAAGLGVFVLVTAITGVCILYIPFGISTLEAEKKQSTS